MESYSSSYSSSNKSSYISQNNKEVNGSMKHDQYPFQSKYSWLRSVRKSPLKKPMKARIAPMPPTPVKVYKVDRINFKELVQSLTCAPEFTPPQPDHHNLQSTDNNISHDTVPSLPMQFFSNSRVDTVEVFPPLVPVAVSTPNNWYHYFQAEYFEKNCKNDRVMTPGLLEMNLLSPTSFGNWCFVPPIMSPTV
ncbi:unnamed protein product [Lathyrus oleraceus]|uniref:VQ domain-containing protein n=1 Tax=Pisum sativum TaxID=3888 RepID=A0A9D5ASN2_PEA|nr:uncharacterized protein LOC127074347 [Pisum sativum]KAI5417891.1 hypothetical protein KIW84_042499 [Pisum sativum]